MPRLTLIKTNFTSGEISPRLLARVDVNRYNNGAKTMLNAYPLVHGGARRRAGLRYTAAAKNASKTARLLPFVFNRTQAFLLEFGELYIRFYTASGQVLSGGSPYEIAAPWDDLELSALRYAHGGDTLFLAHASYATRVLKRFSNTSWKLSEATWEVPPSEEIGERPNTTLTLTATSGAGVTATAGGASFMNSDVGRYIESGAGLGKIVGFTSTTVVTVDIATADAFSSVGPIAANSWKITETPKVRCTPSVTGPVGAAITLTAAANAWKNTAQLSHIGMYVEINDGLVEITGVTSALVATGVVRTVLASTTAAESGGWALRQAVWNALDGYPQAVTLFEQRLLLAGSTQYPNRLWGTKTGEYYNFADGVADSDGYSFALASDQVNAIEHLTSTRALLPLTYGGEFSLTGGVEKPLTPTNVQARAQSAYGSSTVRPVRVANEIIYVQRGGKKIRALGYRVESDSYNAPDISVLSEHVTGGGITDMAFAQEPDQVVWMVRTDGTMVSLSIDRDQDSIGFARHSTDGTIESVACIPSADGVTDQLWALVKRTINGATVRYVERMEEGLQTDCAITGAVTESAIVSASWAAGVLTITQTAHGYTTGDTIRLSAFGITAIDTEHTITVTGANTYTLPLTADPGTITTPGTAAKAATVWTGLNALNGETVDVVADGYVAPQATVAANQITLAKAAYSVEIGLHYKTTIDTLPPEVGTGTGTAQGNAISIHEIVVRFYKTKGGTVNGTPVLTRAFGASVLDQPIPEYTGDRRIGNLGWGKTGSGQEHDGAITIEQDQPLPMQVLGVITRLSVNDG